MRTKGKILSESMAYAPLGAAEQNEFYLRKLELEIQIDIRDALVEIAANTGRIEVTGEDQTGK